MPEPKQNSVNHDKALPEGKYSQTWGLRGRAPEKDASDMQRRLAEECDAKAELQGQLHAAWNALGALHQTDTYRKDDAQISKLAKELRSAIKVWSVKAALPEKKKRIGRQNWPFRSVTRFDERYKNPADFPRLVQGFLWASLLAQVFQQFVWAGSLKCPDGMGDKPCKYRDTLSKMTTLLSAKPAWEGATQEDVIAEQEAYHNWRAQTSRMIARRAHRKCINKTIELITKEIAKDLKGLVEDRDVLNDRDESNTTLASIVASAVDLDRVLAQQKACFEFHRCYNGALWELDTRWMDPAFDEATQTYFASRQVIPIVQLFSAPTLDKFGTSEGRDFKQILVLILPAEVDCEIPAGLHAQQGQGDKPMSSG